MTWLRFAPRHIHGTVCDYLTERLDELGWTDSTPPLGAPQVRIQTFMPPESELQHVTAGLCAISMGDEIDAIEEELGGPLHSQEYPIFVDVFMEKEAHALSLATDIRDCFRGRLTNTVRSMPVMDQTQDPPTAVPGWRMEFQDIQRERIDRLPIFWHSVKLTAFVEFQEVLW
jgi:hypothetical protein